MNKDLIKLIKDALVHMGCPLSVLGKIDPNSPIEFTFNNGIVMHLTMANEAMWLYSPVEDYNEKLIEQNGARFLVQIMRPYPFFVTGKLSLSNENGKLVLQGMVNEETLKSVPFFATALQVFFDAALKLRQIIKE